MTATRYQKSILFYGYAACCLEKHAEHKPSSFISVHADVANRMDDSQADCEIIHKNSRSKRIVCYLNLVR